MTRTRKSTSTPATVNQHQDPELATPSHDPSSRPQPAPKPTKSTSKHQPDSDRTPLDKAGEGTTSFESPTQAQSASGKNKRKSVVFDPVEPSGSSEAIPRATRSRRNSTSTPSTSTNPQANDNLSNLKLSAKALGKRRALSPPLDQTPVAPSVAATPTSSTKRRKLVHPPSVDKDYNLRSRPASSTASIQPKVAVSSEFDFTPTSKPRANKKMPRKGSRASRAAKTKAQSAGQESDQEFEESFDAGSENVGSSSKEQEKVAQDVEMEESEALPSKDPEVVEGSSMAIATGGDGGGDDGGSDDDDDDDISDEDHDDDEDDDDEDDEEDPYLHRDMMDEMDDDEEDYEASLGLGTEGGGLGDYNSEGESEIDAPQTYDANGSPLPSSSSFEHGAAERAMEEAADAADGLSLGGRGGAAAAGFRALQGLMSGMTSRLKGVLTTLRNKEGDSSAKLIALQDLAELLSVSTEDTLAGYFQVEPFVKELVIILKGDSNGSGGGGGSGGGSSGLTAEEMIAFGMDPNEGSGGGNDEESNVQMMLLACRCLANLMEALPGSSHSVVYAGAVPVLCSKLLEIQYIDLAEQTLSTLEKISEEVPSSIVREGGLSALLTYLDFFSFHVQRTAVTAAANCCRSLSPDSFNMVKDVMPIFKNVLGYPDQKVVEQACLAVVRIVDSYRHYPEKLEALLTSDLLVAIRALLNPDSTTVGSGTYTQILKMLSTAAKASPEVAIALVELNIARTLYHLLAGISAPDFSSDDGPQVLVRDGPGEDMLIMQNLVQRPKEQIQETLGLVCELLPPLPKDGIFDPRAFSGRERSSRTSKVKREEVTPDLSGGVTGVSSSTAVTEAAGIKVETAEDGVAVPAPLTLPLPRSSKDIAKELIVEKRLQLLRADIGTRSLIVKRYYALLLPTLVEVYAASVNTQVRTKALLGLLKIINFCAPQDLAEILKTVAMSSFLAAILCSRDQSSLLTNALQLVELLLVKMPDAYQYFFRREGVMHEIEKVAASPILSAPKSKSRRSSADQTPKAAEITPLPTPSTAAGPSGIARALQQLSDTSSALSTMTAQASTSATAESTTPSISTSDALARDMITLRARHLRDQYGSADSEPAVRARSALENIRSVVKALTVAAAAAKISSKQEGAIADLVDEVASLFSHGKNPMSSFEMSESGLVDGLLQFATQSEWTGLSVIRRQELLAASFMPNLQLTAPTAAFSLLVKRLQESLSRMEDFEVELAAQNPSEAETRRNGPSMLARQLKLKLVAEEGSDIPRSCSNVVVSIHAIATFQAFNDYLRPRILAATALSDRSGASTSASQPGAAGMLSGFLAAFAAANGSSPPDSNLPASGSGSRILAGLGGTLAASPPATTVSPSVRRSTRLNGKGVDEPDNEASTSKTTLDTASDAPAAGPIAAQDPDDNVCIDDNDHDMQDDGDDDLFAGAFDPAPAPRDDRPVNLEVADDGSKLIAKTPDGTRVGTPTLGHSASTQAATPDAKPRASYAAAVKAEPTDWHLEFSINGHRVSLDTTIYGGVHNFGGNTDTRRNMWSAIYTVTFKKISGPAPTASESDSPELLPRKDATLVALPDSIPVDSQQAKILQLLGVLHALNSDYGDVNDGAKGLAEGAFVNNKLTAKLNRQLEEPMIVASACLPRWATDLPKFFPFLFPFDTRYAFLQSTAFGYARLMQKWVGQARADSSRRDDNLGFLGRLQRQKVRISRDRMLDSAFKVFELYGSSRASLEVEFFAEVGSGLGPTLEFYALVSKEFARKDLLLWRDGDATNPSAFVYNLAGLFPNPSVESTNEEAIKRLKVFRVLGQFVAKAMMDSRIIDVHFSRTFMKLVLGVELPLTIATVQTVDKELASSLAQLQEYAVEKRKIEADESLTEDAILVAINAIELRGATVADLTLDFTLPGHSINLKEGGSDLAVDASNIEEYISLVIEWTLRKGVTQQVDEFKAGFSSVFPARDLLSFTASELVMLTGALDEDWSVEGLTNSTKADHGFTMDSRPVRDFLSIMSEFTNPERREFLSFITGSPRLPIGGFAALSPALTIVRKDGGDGSLPSVMTCVNYIKLPNYSSREIVKARVLTAVQEGAGGFHLS